MEQHCPWLGTREDAATHYAYPTSENLCGAPKGPGALDLSHQADLCLRDQHIACPFYLRPDSPEALAAPERLAHPLAELPWGRIAMAGIGVFILALTAVAIANSTIGRNNLEPIGTATPAATTLPIANPPTVARTTPLATRTVLPFSPTPAASSTFTATPVTYVVVAGDTLARIANRYGVTVQAIVAANNLKDPSALRAGTVLIIPIGPGYAATFTRAPATTPSTAVTPGATP